MDTYIGHYRIVSELGRGGMGVVYKAHEQSLNRYVALKVLGEHLCEDQSYVDRFIREAQSAAALNHPNIVQVYAISEHEGQQYFAMEYVTGTSIQRLIRSQGKIDPVTAAGLVLQASHGLAAAHAEGIVHRDIKPANLMVDQRGLVKIADFGLALLAGGATRLTATGMFMGTPGYLSPEQCLDQDVDHRADIYSLGVAFFEMLTGTVPFRADSPLALIRQIVEVDPPEITELNPDVPPELRLILVKMMHKDRNERYESCEVVAQDLQDWLDTAGAGKRSVSSIVAAAVGSAAGAAQASGSTRPARVTTATPEQLEDDPTVQVDSAELAEPPAASSPPPPPPASPAAESAEPTVVADGDPARFAPSPQVEAVEEKSSPSSSRRLVAVLAVAAVLMIAVAGLAGLALWKTGLIGATSNGQDTMSPVAALEPTPIDRSAAMQKVEGDPTGETDESGPVGALSSRSSEAPDQPGAGIPTAGSPEPAAVSPKETVSAPQNQRGESPSSAAVAQGAQPSLGAGSSVPPAVESAGDVQPVAPPPDNTVALISVGETLLAGEAEAYLRRVLTRRGLVVVDGRAVPGIRERLQSGELSGQQELVRDVLRSHARWLVFVRAEYTGDRPLYYQGQHDVEYRGRLHVVTRDLESGRAVGDEIHVPIGYSQLTVERKTAEILRKRFRETAAEMQQYSN